MKAVASLVFGIASAVGLCIGVVAVASYVMAEQESKTITNTSVADLWTNAPVRVDVGAQTYERLPALLSTYALETPAHEDAPAQKTGVNVLPAAAQPQALSADHLDWCAKRYRSFDPATNSYRAYDGEVRACTSPFDRAAEDHVTAVTAPSDPQAAAWCAARYKSYRAEDNSYQPYGGPRRPCTPQDDTPAVMANAE